MASVKVSVHTEWDPLTAVVVGVDDKNCIPSDCEPGVKVNKIYSSEKFVAGQVVKAGLRPDDAYINSARELDNFVRILKDHQVQVFKPEHIDWNQPISTPFWTVYLLFLASI
jgi:hypothetical protein